MVGVGYLIPPILGNTSGHPSNCPLCQAWNLRYLTPYTLTVAPLGFKCNRLKAKHFAGDLSFAYLEFPQTAAAVTISITVIFYIDRRLEVSTTKHKIKSSTTAEKRNATRDRDRGEGNAGVKIHHCISIG